MKNAPPPPPALCPPGQTDIPKICLQFSVAHSKKPAQRDMPFALCYDLSGWSKIVHVLQLTNLSMLSLD